VWSSTDNMLAGFGPTGDRGGFSGIYAERKPAWIT